MDVETRSLVSPPLHVGRAAGRGCPKLALFPPESKRNRAHAAVFRRIRKQQDSQARWRRPRLRVPVREGPHNRPRAELFSRRIRHRRLPRQDLIRVLAIRQHRLALRLGVRRRHGRCGLRRLLLPRARLLPPLRDRRCGLRPRYLSAAVGFRPDPLSLRPPPRPPPPAPPGPSPPSPPRRVPRSRRLRPRRTQPAIGRTPPAPTPEPRPMQLLPVDRQCPAQANVSLTPLRPAPRPPGSPMLLHLAYTLLAPLARRLPPGSAYPLRRPRRRRPLPRLAPRTTQHARQPPHRPPHQRPRHPSTTGPSASSAATPNSPSTPSA